MSYPHGHNDVTFSDFFIDRPPGWLEKSGATLSLLFVMLLLAISVLLKYPDIVSGKAIVTNFNPTVVIKSLIDSEVQKVFVNDLQLISAGEPLILLKSDVDYNEILVLEELLVKLEHDLASLSEGNISTLPKLSSLGAIQNSFNLLKTEIFSYVNMDESSNLDASMRKDLNLYNSLKEKIEINNELINLTREKLRTQTERLKNSFSLKEKGLIAAVQLEEIQKEHIDIKLQLQQFYLAKREFEQAISQLDSNTEMMVDSLANRKKASRLDILNLIKRTSSEIDTWKSRFLLSSQQSGQVILDDVIYPGKNVFAGKDILHIRPQNDGGLIVRINVIPIGIGMVELDNKVLVELDGYPSGIYGNLTGRVCRISKFPVDGQYVIDVMLINDSTTDLGINIPLAPYMPGVAHVITNERRLIQRVFSHIYKIFNLHT